MPGLIPRKIRFIYLLGFILALTLIIFAFRWQLVEAAKLTNEIALRKQEYIIPSVRGPILARDGSTLAYSEPRFDAYVFMREVKLAESNSLQSRSEFYKKIQPFTTYSSTELEDLFTNKEKQGIEWFKIAENLTLAQKTDLSTLKREKDNGYLNGVSTVYSQQRFYPEKTLAAHVLGFTGKKDDGGLLGKQGLEREWNGDLEPQKGYVQYDIDAKGNPVSGSTGVTLQAKRGSTVVTSIDKFLQRKVEEGLQKGIAQFKAESGSGVIIDPKNGEILAIANYPTFDPNDLNTVTDPDVLGNPAVSQPYEIGSVGKAFTLSAAIDSGTYHADDVVIDGHKGCESLIEGYRVCVLHNIPVNHPLTLVQATVASDNIAYYHIANKLTPPVMYNYLTKFGVGHASGVDLSREESYGYLKDPSKWNLNDISAYAYGTSYQMNAVQAASAIGSIANNGVRMKPHLVTKIVEADGKEVVIKPQAVEQVISEASSTEVQWVMNRVFESNLTNWDYNLPTNYYTKLHNDPIAMKSGTGLIVKDGQYSNNYNATYVGFDMSPNHRFIMLIKLNSPQIGAVSRDNARLVWLDTYLSIRDYLGITKQ